MQRKLVSAGLLAGLVAGTGAGLILQQTGLAGASNGVATVVVDDSTTTDTSGTDTSGTDDTATTDDRAADRDARLREVLQALVDDGTLTAAQLDAVVSTLDAAGPVRGDMPGGMPGGMQGDMPGGRGGHGPGDHGRGGNGFGIDAAATALGLTTDELRTELEGGSTIAEVAQAHDVDVQTVIDAMVADQTARLADRVEDGDLTQAEADAKLAEVTTRVTDMVNNGGPARPADAPAPADEAPATTDAATS